MDPRDLPVARTSADQARTDQFWQAATFASNGSFVVSSYDRQYGDDETSGFSDMSVSVGRDLAHFDQDRATSCSSNARPANEQDIYSTSSDSSDRPPREPDGPRTMRAAWGTQNP